MRKRAAMIFLVFSSAMICLSIWSVTVHVSEWNASVWEHSVHPLLTYVQWASPSVGPWIVLLAVSCIGLGIPKKGS